MSVRFKVGDLVVRNPEARGTSGWPHGDAACRVVDVCPAITEVITVVPVNSPPNTRHHNITWFAERFTHAATTR